MLWDLELTFETLFVAQGNLRTLVENLQLEFLLLGAALHAGFLFLLLRVPIEVLARVLRGLIQLLRHSMAYLVAGGWSVRPAAPDGC